MVVGVDLGRWLVGTGLSAGEVVCRQSGQHLVHVHVGGRAGAGLVGIDRELGIVDAGDYLVGGDHDGVGDCAVENAEFFIGKSGGLFDAG